MADQTPVLDIDTLVSRKPVRIDGKAYEILNKGELSLFDTARLKKLTTRLGELEALAKMSAKQEAEYLKGLRQVVSMVVVGLPPVVCRRLLRPHCVAIVREFFQIPRPTPAAAPAGDKTPARRSTTAN